jgi:membrane-associated phospholipid phosphatase
MANTNPDSTAIPLAAALRQWVLPDCGHKYECLTSTDLARSARPGRPPDAPLSSAAQSDPASLILNGVATYRVTRRGPAAASRAWTAAELLFGLTLLAAAAVAGLLFAKRPGPNRVDAAGYFYVPSDPNSHLANELVRLGSKPVLIVGIIVVFLIAIFRDWVRAFACAAAPVIAVEVVEHIAKPMVGREIGVGSFTYPSGTVAAIAALSTAVLLVSPRLMRPLVALAGVAAVTGTGLAVLVLRWHYPTDVVGGVWVGCGAVFTIDAVAHIPWLLAPRRPWAETPGNPQGTAPPVRV